MSHLSHASPRNKLFPILIGSTIMGAVLSVTTLLSAVFMTNKLSFNIGIILSAFSALLFLFLAKNIYSFYKMKNELDRGPNELSKRTNACQSDFNTLTTFGFFFGFGGLGSLMIVKGIDYLKEAHNALRDNPMNNPVLTVLAVVMLSVGIFSILLMAGIFLDKFISHDNEKSDFHSQSQINSKAPLEAEKSPKIAESKKEWSTPLVNTSDTEGIFVQQARADGIIEAAISAISNKVLESVNEESRKTTDSPMLILQTRLEAAQRVLLSNSLQPPAYSK